MMRSIILLILMASPAVAQEGQLPRTSFPGPWIIDCSTVNCTVTEFVSPVPFTSRGNVTISNAPRPVCQDDKILVLVPPSTPMCADHLYQPTNK